MIPLDELEAEAKAVVERALSLGANDAVATISQGRSTQFRHRDGELEQVRESRSKSLGMQLFVDGRWSAHSTCDLRPDAVGAFLTDAVALTRALQPDPHRLLPDPELYEGRSEIDLDLTDPDLLEEDRARSLEWLSIMDELAHDDDRVISATAHLAGGHGRSARATSNGFLGSEEGTGLSLYTEVTLDDRDSGKRPEAYAMARSVHLADLLAPEEIGREALARGKARLGAAKGESERVRLVVDREAAVGLLSRAFGALSAASIQQKRSFLADKLDQPIAASCLTIVDDPLIPRGLGSQHFDGEGIAARKRAVIEEGCLRTFFVDTYYGRKLGWAPTTGGSSNLIFALGDDDRDGLLKSAGSGIYVTSWNGGNSDATTGDFSFGLSGHRIEDGAIGAPVSEMNVTGNYLELLERLVAVGSDPHPWSSMRVPSLLFDGIQVSGT